jgi:protein-L-isoaspartate(D-aspartate) O-methyltransferase
MERLQEMLRQYNNTRIDDRVSGGGWSVMYQQRIFPEYWKRVFIIANSLPRTLKVLEIGSGFGFVTSIFAYLGYDNLVGFEKDVQIAKSANNRLRSLFNIESCIKSEVFENQYYSSDLLVLVNCVYSDGLKSKEEYLRKILSYYEHAGYPRYFILEVIDESYKEPNDIFPPIVRLCKNDIVNLFKKSKIQLWPTYVYPKNHISKTLYYIETL